jgi:hypothetical protein
MLKKVRRAYGDLQWWWLGWRRKPLKCKVGLHRPAMCLKGGGHWSVDFLECLDCQERWEIPVFYGPIPLRKKPRYFRRKV